MNYLDRLEEWYRGYDREDPYFDTENSKTDEELIDYIVDSEEDDYEK